MEQYKRGVLWGGTAPVVLNLGGIHGAPLKGHFQPSTEWGGWAPPEPPRGGQAKVGGGTVGGPMGGLGGPQKWGLGGSPMGEDLGGGLLGGPQSWGGGAQVGPQGAG